MVTNFRGGGVGGGGGGMPQFGTMRTIGGRTGFQNSSGGMPQLSMMRSGGGRTMVQNSFGGMTMQQMLLQLEALRQQALLQAYAQQDMLLRQSQVAFAWASGQSDAVLQAALGHQNPLIRQAATNELGRRGRVPGVQINVQ